MGYCLRMVSMNRLNLHWLRRSAGIPFGKRVLPRYAPSLAWILGCSTTWIEDALPVESRHLGDRHYIWSGQRLFFKNQLRSVNPQICPVCVHQEGFCKRVWDLSLVTSCTIHQCMLVDACEHCKVPLRWDRPALDVCICGRPFSSKNAQPGSASFESMTVSQAVETCLAGLSFKSNLLASRSPACLHALSLGGLLCALHGFGSRPYVHAPCHASITSRAGTTADWTQVVHRACARLLQAASLPPALWPQLEPIVSETLIEHLALKSPDPADQQVGRYLLHHMRGTEPGLAVDASAPHQIDFGFNYD